VSNINGSKSCDILSSTLNVKIFKLVCRSALKLLGSRGHLMYPSASLVCIKLFDTNSVARVTIIILIA